MDSLSRGTSAFSGIARGTCCASKMSCELHIDLCMVGPVVPQFPTSRLGMSRTSPFSMGSHFQLRHPAVRRCHCGHRGSAQAGRGGLISGGPAMDCMAEAEDNSVDVHGHKVKMRQHRYHPMLMVEAQYRTDALLPLAGRPVRHFGIHCLGSVRSRICCRNRQGRLTEGRHQAVDPRCMPSRFCTDFDAAEYIDVPFQF